VLAFEWIFFLLFLAALLRSACLQAAPLTEEERMIPWITTEEALAFDWDAAEANAPFKGARYVPLPRVAERVRLAVDWKRIKARASSLCSCCCSAGGRS
jgi:hypothetical protein